MTRHAASRTILWTAIVWLVFAGAATATNQRPAAHSKHPPSHRAPVRDNILLITIDTLRADHLGCYGYKDIHTPTIDALARDGVRFEHATAQVPLTWPSHAAILTGTYPFQNGVQDFTSRALSPQFQTIAQGLKRRGYTTAAVVSTFVLDRSWGLARGFDYYDDAFAGSQFLEADVGALERKAEPSVTHAIQWLQNSWLKKARAPFFLWLHLYDPHTPYDPPEPYLSQYRRQPYDGEIAYTDHELARLISWLKAHKLYASSLIILLSDHGESLGEHGESEHGLFIYNSTVHVPLIVKPPAGSGRKPSVVNEPVETVAVAPTIFEVLRISDPIQKQFQSKSVFANTAASTVASYSESFYPFSYFGWSPLHALENQQYHYIDAPDPELYDLLTDPEEKNNIAAKHEAILDVLKEQLRQRLARKLDVRSTEVAPGISPDAAEKLRALGYFAYGAPVAAVDLNHQLVDPKSRLWEFNGILHAGVLFQAGNYEEGKALLESIGQRDPGMYLVPFMLAEAALRRRDWTTAVAEFQKCLQLSPNFEQAMTGVAQALQGAGEAAQARYWLDRALAVNPQNYRAWYEIGKINATSDATAAMDAYTKALAIQPNFPLAHRDLGILQLQRGEYERASQELEKAIHSGLNQPLLYNFLGIAYSRTNRLTEAVSSYQRALKANPNLAEAHLNLAYAYQRLGRPSLARTEYAVACRLQQKFCSYMPASRK